MRKDVAKLMNAKGSYIISSAMPGTPVKCLDVKGGKSENGVPLILYYYHGNKNQKFKLSEV